MYSDMNDKKSYTVEDVQRICVDRFKRLDGIRQWKVQFDSNWNKKGGGEWEHRENREVSFFPLKL